MSDQPTAPGTPAPGAPEAGSDQWLTTPETYASGSETPPGAPPAGRPRWVPWAAGAGLVAVGVLMGGGVALALSGNGDDRPGHRLGQEWGQGSAPGQQAPPPPGFPGDGDGHDDDDGSFQQPGGVAGDLRGIPQPPTGASDGSSGTNA